MCWYGGLSLKCKNVLDIVVNVGGKIVGERQKRLNQLYECIVAQKTRMIASDENHVPAKQYELLPSGKRYHSVQCKTVRTKLSFLYVCECVRVYSSIIMDII